MTAPGALTEDDVAQVRGEAVAGRPATVWFTTAAVGVTPGGSAKVVAVGDVADGEFIQVRRTGSRDTMFCSPNELTRTRPARRRASAGPPVKAAAPAAAPAEAPAARRRATTPVQLTVHLRATAEGEWSVEVSAGTRTVVPATPVPAAGVATAARSLPPAVAAAIGSALEGARRRQRTRVEQLRAELDAAQHVLDQFEP